MNPEPQKRRTHPQAPRAYQAATPSPESSSQPPNCWVAVKELNFSYHNPETIVFGVYPYYSNLNLSSLTATPIEDLRQHHHNEKSVLQELTEKKAHQGGLGRVRSFCRLPTQRCVCMYCLYISVCIYIYTDMSTYVYMYTRR